MKKFKEIYESLIVKGINNSPTLTLNRIGKLYEKLDNFIGGSLGRTEYKIKKIKKDLDSMENEKAQKELLDDYIEEFNDVDKDIKELDSVFKKLKKDILDRYEEYKEIISEIKKEK